MPTIVTRCADLEEVPWRNGLGLTREVAVESDAVGPLWRISIADVSAAGPFSTFDGLDRVLLVVGGEGLVLDVDGVEHHLSRLDSHEFAGEAATFGRPVGGAVQALNLMTRRGSVDGSLRIIHAGDGDAVGPPGGATVLLAIDPMDVHVGTSEVHLDPLDAVRAEAPVTITTGGAAVLVTVRVSRDPSGS